MNTAGRRQVESVFILLMLVPHTQSKSMDSYYLMSNFKCKDAHQCYHRPFCSCCLQFSIFKCTLCRFSQSKQNKRSKWCCIMGVVVFLSNNNCRNVFCAQPTLSTSISSIAFFLFLTLSRKRTWTIGLSIWHSEFCHKLCSDIKKRYIYIGLGSTFRIADPDQWNYAHIGPGHP